MWKIDWKALRGAVTFGLGATGFLHELLVSEGERPFILTASLALMGLELVLRADEKLRGKD